MIPQLRSSTLRMEHFERKHYTVHVLLGRHVASFSIDPPHSFQLVFDSGDRLPFTTTANIMKPSQLILAEKQASTFSHANRLTRRCSERLLALRFNTYAS